MEYLRADKHMVNMVILKILQDYTDDDHWLTQKEILKILKEEYDLDCDRRTVGSNIDFLRDLGYDISSIPRKGYCLETREFEDAELRMLIDSVLFSRMISTRQAQKLIGKLAGLSNRYFSARVSHVSNLPEYQHSDNQQILYSVEIINDAIDGNRKISFTYCRYDTDFKLHPFGTNPRTVSPYRMVANNGRYYLLCYDELHGSLSYYRIDRMKEVTPLEQKRKKIADIPGMEHGLNVGKHMAEHFYMFPGESVPVVIRTTRSMMGDLIDWFGKDITVLQEERTGGDAASSKSCGSGAGEKGAEAEQETALKQNGNDRITVRVSCNEQSVFYWALQYGPAVEILSPSSLRTRLKDTLSGMLEKYAR